MTDRMPVPYDPGTELPTDEVMLALDLTPSEFPDFHRALRATLLMVHDSLSIAAACEAIHLPRRSFYEEKWQTLLRKAQRLVAGKAMLGVKNADNIVLENWPQIIQGRVNDALFALEAKDRIAATALLYEMVVQASQTTRTEEDAEAQYLKGNKSFNPMAILANINTLHIHTNQPPGEIVTGEVIDVE